jgi:hypothetical protein
VGNFGFATRWQRPLVFGALGIGAEDNWDACFSAYLSQNQNPANSASGKDIIWRSSNQSVKLLASLATDPSIALKNACVISVLLIL